MEEDRVPTGRTLRRRNEKVAKHLKRGANGKEKENFRKRVFRIPIDKPFEEAYYTHRLWMFFRETREKEEDIKRMFSCHCGAEYETEYSASIETHTATSIDSGHQKSTDTPPEESIDSRPDDWENDYYNPIMAVNDAPLIYCVFGTLYTRWRERREKECELESFAQNSRPEQPECLLQRHR
ncbi:hypothetical protein F2Q68_00035348 [Brassica cretica]|uniref:Uncharacterized protein n=1 Tax=Brassica cretica TaxID=69181 RepID=A0A8S9GVC5_BRACR|nr:hypothetical protein F2Q68_00035348 [Brassica cretica]